MNPSPTSNPLWVTNTMYIIIHLLCSVTLPPTISVQYVICMHAGEPIVMVLSDAVAGGTAIAILYFYVTKVYNNMFELTKSFIHSADILMYYRSIYLIHWQCICNMACFILLAYILTIHLLHTYNYNYTALCLLQKHSS